MIPEGLMFGKRPWNNELHDAERATWKSRHVCGQPRPLPLYHPDSRGSAVSPNRVAGVVDRESADGTISMNWVSNPLNTVWVSNPIKYGSPDKVAAPGACPRVCNPIANGRP